MPLRPWVGAATRQFRRNMDDLNSYLSTHRVSRDLAHRLREYFHQTKHLSDAPNHTRLLQLMSPMLQSELVLAVNRLKSLQKLYLFEQKGGENYLG